MRISSGSSTATASGPAGEGRPSLTGMMFTPTNDPVSRSSKGFASLMTDRSHSHHKFRELARVAEKWWLDWFAVALYEVLRGYQGGLYTGAQCAGSIDKGGRSNTLGVVPITAPVAEFGGEAQIDTPIN